MGETWLSSPYKTSMQQVSDHVGVPVSYIFIMIFIAGNSHTSATRHQVYTTGLNPITFTVHIYTKKLTTSYYIHVQVYRDCVHVTTIIIIITYWLLDSDTNTVGKLSIMLCSVSARRCRFTISTNSVPFHDSVSTADRSLA